MEPVLMYLLKMFICSAVLYGYYRLALYNERFHQWNRFYLLAALLLSVTVPLISIPVMLTSADSDLATVIAFMPWNVDKGIEHTTFSWQDAVLVSVSLVSAVFILRVLIGLVKIVMAYRSHPVSNLQHNVQLVLTNLTQAPFSFFNWLFWRVDIDPASANGRRMLNHELTHIREYHSIDKLFTSLLLCVFWMNPFFWLMRRELSMIHEFLADRKAISPRDGAAFADMILQAMPLTPAVNNGLINPFFSSQIKRRLLMITKSNDPKYSYLRRVSGLALMICSVFALALSIQHAEAQKEAKIVKDKPAVATTDSTVKQKKFVTTKDNVIYLIADTIIYNKKKNEVITITAFGEKKVNLTIEQNDNKNINGQVNKVVIVGNENALKDGKDNPLYIVEGKEIEEVEMKEIDPNRIKEVNVFKGEMAADKYGDKGKNGVVEIKLKEVQIGAKEVVVKGYGKKESNETMGVTINKNASPLFYVDGKSITSEEMKKIKPNDIESVNVLKGDSAIKKYGEKAKDGVVEITMKKPIT